MVPPDVLYQALAASILSLVFGILVGVIRMRCDTKTMDQYDEAIDAYEAGQYLSAIERFLELVNERDGLFDGPTPTEYIHLCINQLKAQEDHSAEISLLDDTSQKTERSL